MTEKGFSRVDVYTVAWGKQLDHLTKCQIANVWLTFTLLTCMQLVGQVNLILQEVDRQVMSIYTFFCLIALHIKVFQCLVATIVM